MIKLIDELNIDYVKRGSARKNFTNTIYSCFYSALNNKYDIGANIMCFQHRLFLYRRCFDE